MDDQITPAAVTVAATVINAVADQTTLTTSNVNAYYYDAQLSALLIKMFDVAASLTIEATFAV